MSIKDLIEQDEQERRDRAELARLKALEQLGQLGKYTRPPFTDPQPHGPERCGRCWMSFWMMVVWILALVACIIWGPNP